MRVFGETAVGAGFSPGLADARANGIKASRESYPTDRKKQLLTTIDKIAFVIREGKDDPAVIGYAGDVISTSAKFGSTRKRVQALCDEVQRVMTYAPDPVGAEYIVSAAGMLCLRPGLCVRVSDCDGLLALLGSMCAGIGIHVQIVGLYYGESTQPHVCMVFEDDSGEWKYIDPTAGLQPGTKKLPIGFSPPKAKEEFWADPLESMTGPEIVLVGVGGVSGEGISAGWRRADGRWWTHGAGGWYRSNASGDEWTFAGAGALPPDLSPPAASDVGAGASVPGWQPLDSVKDVIAGHRYFVSALMTLPAAGGTIQGILGSDWTVTDTDTGQGAVTEGIARAIRFIGTANVSAPKDTETVTYLAVFEEVMLSQPVTPGAPPPAGVTVTTPSAPLTTPAAPPALVPPAPSSAPAADPAVGVGQVAVGALIVAGAAGLAWGIWKANRGRSKSRALTTAEGY